MGLLQTEDVNAALASWTLPLQRKRLSCTKASDALPRRRTNPGNTVHVPVGGRLSQQCGRPMSHGNMGHA